MACLRGPCPSAQLLKCLCSAHRKIIWLCPPVKGCKKEEINTLFSQADHFQGCFARLMASFTLLSPFLLCEKVLSIFAQDMHTACHGCRPWITILCLSQLVWFREITDSLFVLGESIKPQGSLTSSCLLPCPDNMFSLAHMQRLHPNLFLQMFWPSYVK